MNTLKIFAPACLAAIALTLVACANNSTRDEHRSDAQAPRSQPVQRTTETAASPTPPAASAPTTPQRAPATPAGKVEPQFTGIEVCDEYLATYDSCHATIGTNVEQRTSRLAELRKVWQERAKDSTQHDLLKTQCQSLADSMKEALHGRDCELPESDFVEPDRTDFDNVEGDSTYSND